MIPLKASITDSKHPTSAKPACSILMSVLADHGVEDVICSPGSRNAPLLIAADSCASLSTHLVIDERIAAFVALGMALMSRKPVALICTSGSALLNYAPAVAEAFYRGIPLIVISADRPMQWIDQDDSQTLRQVMALHNYVKHSYDIPDGMNEAEWYANRVANDAMIEALKGRKGPVHINVQLDNPLNSLAPQPQHVRSIRLIQGSDRLKETDVQMLAKSIEGKKIMVVAGFMLPDNKLSVALRSFASLPQVYVLAETPSNLHVPEACTTIDTLLSFLSDEEKQFMQPDVVITLGGALVSRFIKTYLRSLKNSEHWTIGHSHTTVDCFKTLTARIEADPAPLLRQLTAILRKCDFTSDYALRWQNLYQKAIERHNRFMHEAEWCDLKAYEIILNSLPQKCSLHLSNGTPIRYAQLFRMTRPVPTYCNRGVSGIDGCTSTAIGAAIKSALPVILISGDISFSYDIGALGLAPLPDNLKIIVMNNSGGDIFRFIPSTRDLSQREKYFCCAPNLPLKKLCEAYDIAYLRAANLGELRLMIKNLIAFPKAALLEIFTPADRNTDILRNYLNC